MRYLRCYEAWRPNIRERIRVDALDRLEELWPEILTQFPCQVGDTKKFHTLLLQIADLIAGQVESNLPGYEDPVHEAVTDDFTEEQEELYIFLDNAVQDIFIALHPKYGTTSGDISPEEVWRLEKHLEDLTYLLLPTQTNEGFFHSEDDINAILDRAPDFSDSDLAILKNFANEDSDVRELLIKMKACTAQFQALKDRMGKNPDRETYMKEWWVLHDEMSGYEHLLKHEYGIKDPLILWQYEAKYL